MEDNCPRTPNTNQTDSDGDGLGDVCDDCPHVYDPLQKLDSIGLPAACPGTVLDWDRDDTDEDGIPNLNDNCPLVHNVEQIDSDADGVGDVCDNDIDGDGVENHADDCPLIFNPDQNGNQICILALNLHFNLLGCHTDSDNDGIFDINDICPDDPLISHVDFAGYETVLLDPLGTAQLDPYWVVMNKVTMSKL